MKFYMNEIYFLYDYRDKVGSGQLIRCIELAKHLSENFSMVPVAIEIEKFGSKLGQNLFNSITLDISYRFNSYVVVDIVNKYNELSFIKCMISELHTVGFYIIFINGTGPFDICEQIGLKKNDINLEPFYLGQKNKQFQFTNIRHISYNLVPKKFYEFVWCGEGSSKILITSGNSDPYYCSLRILNLLKKTTIPDIDEINVLIGSAFDDYLVSKLKCIKFTNYQLNLVSGIHDLTQVIKDVSVVISADGLTKYELAVSGVPSLFFSIDKSNKEANKEFEKIKFGLSLGLCESIASKDLNLALLEAKSSDFIKKTKTIQNLYFSKPGLDKLGKTLCRLMKKI